VPDHDVLVARSNALIEHARFVTLASHGPAGVTAWWLIDLAQWLETKDDRRIAVDLAALSDGPGK
jgi:hypothetical protein